MTAIKFSSLFLHSNNKNTAIIAEKKAVTIVIPEFLIILSSDANVDIILDSIAFQPVRSINQPMVIT